MRKMKLLLCIMLLVGCTSQQENDSNVVSNSTTSSRPQVYTATPQTTKEPEINIVTTPQVTTSEVTTVTTTVPETVKVTTYPVTTTTTTTTTTVVTTTTETTIGSDVSSTSTTVTTTAAYTDTEETTTTTTYPFTPIYDKVTNVGYEAVLEINKLRKENNLDEYTLDEYLCIAANLRAREIAEQFSHVRLDYTNFSTVLNEYGFSYTNAAECIGAGYSNAYSMVYAWSHSAKDNKNIMDSKYGFNKVGVGYYYYAGKSYWVMLAIKDGNS